MGDLGGVFSFHTTFVGEVASLRGMRRFGPVVHLPRFIRRVVFVSVEAFSLGVTRALFAKKLCDFVDSLEDARCRSRKTTSPSSRRRQSGANERSGIPHP
jgi:hypothetical protein